MERSPDGFFHPTSEDQIRDLILYARANGLQVRVRGSAHSVPDAIHTDAQRYHRGQMVDLMLDNLIHVRFDDEKKQVTLQGGCRLARDPRDPTKRATDQNGLCYQIDRRGWALPLLAGVTHQTVAGYLATGSEGGSVQHSTYEQIVSIRLIDGTGEVRVLSKESGDLFYAAGVSLGLLGVVTELTLQCVDRFDIVGEESASTLQKSELQLLAAGGFEQYVARTEYGRFLWWPQPKVGKLVIWKARRMQPGERLIKREPYMPMPPVLGSTVPMQIAGGVALRLLGPDPHPFWRVGGGDFPQLPPRERAPDPKRLSPWRSAVYNAFVEETPKPQQFRDTWWQGLPQDNLMVDALMPTTFTELFVPMRHATEALRRLHVHFERFGFQAAGAFATEIYASSGNSFWLSPSYGEPMLRINFFWLQRHKGDPRLDFFPQFWSLLADLGFRLHWAKLLFREGASSAEYLKRQYPKWDAFMAVRERLDPDQVFVSSYWRAHLGIQEHPKHKDRKPSLPAPTPIGKNAVAFVRHPGRELPMVYRFEPTTPEFIERAGHSFDNSAEVDATPEEAYQTFVTVEHAKRWIVLFTGAHWQTQDRDGPGSVVDYGFKFMSLRVRVVERERGKRWVASVDACTLPLGRRMMQVAEFEPLPGGRSRIRWRVIYDMAWYLWPAYPIVQPFFAWFFRRSTRQFAAYMSLRRRK